MANTNIKRYHEIRSAKLALLTTYLLSTVCCEPSPLPIGEPIPDVKLTRLDGTTLSTHDLVPPFVAIFFDDKCPACRTLLGELLKLRLPSEYSSRIFLVSKSTPSVRPSLLIRIRAPIFLLSPDDWKRSFGIRSTPTLLYFDAGKRLARIQIGAHTSKVLERRFMTFLGTK